MKRLICIMLVFAFSSFLFTGCKTKKNSAGEIARKQAEIILECLKTGEKEELKALFCESVKNTHNLDKEIQEAIDFVDGEIVEDGKWIGMSEGGKSVDEGVVVKLDIHPSIIDLKTDNQNTYSIFFDTYLVYNDKKENVGMTYIIISDEKDNQILIGEVIH